MMMMRLLKWRMCVRHVTHVIISAGMRTIWQSHHVDRVHWANAVDIHSCFDHCWPHWKTIEYMHISVQEQAEHLQFHYLQSNFRFNVS